MYVQPYAKHQYRTSYVHILINPSQVEASVVKRGEHGNAPLHPVRRVQVTREQDEADEVRGVACRAQDAPPVRRLVDRTRVGGRLDQVGLPRRLEPHHRRSGKENLRT